MVEHVFPVLFVAGVVAWFAAVVFVSSSRVQSWVVAQYRARVDASGEDDDV